MKKLGIVLVIQDFIADAITKESLNKLDVTNENYEGYNYDILRELVDQVVDNIEIRVV